MSKGRFIVTWIIPILMIMMLASCTSKSERAEQELREGITALYASDMNKAKEHFDKAIELDPDNAVAYFQRANVYSNLQGYELALADLNRSLELEPENADAWFNRGNIHTIMGKKTEACDDYKEAYRLGKVNIYDKVKHCPDPPERR